MADSGTPILLVEDDRDFADAMTDVLEDEGYRVVVALNGRQALDLLETRQCTPFLILLDLMMPVMDGWEFSARVRESPAASIPIGNTTSARATAGTRRSDTTSRTQTISWEPADLRLSRSRAPQK